MANSGRPPHAVPITDAVVHTVFAGLNPVPRGVADASGPLDGYLTEPDAVERHAVVVRAPCAVVRAALWDADLGGPAARAVLALRVLPAAVAGRDDARRRLRALGRRPALTLRDVLETGFACLAETPDALVFGLTGRFWTLGGGVVPTDVHTWAAGPPGGMAHAAWSFEFAALDDGRTRLATETRVRCADAASRRAFRRYWWVVRPGSGVLRRLMLWQIRRAAERMTSRPEIAGTQARR